VRSSKSSIGYKRLLAMLAAILIWAIFSVTSAGAQGRYGNGGTIDAGTTVDVRTNETINTKNTDGEVFTGGVDKDVRDGNGNVVIPRGSNVEMVVRRVSDKDVALDLDSITVNGRRYSVRSDERVVSDQGIGMNKRTGKYVGGGALLGAIIGGVAGGGKGAAIGAGAGAAAGAGAQVLTRGRNVNVPAESLLTFRLSQPLTAGVPDTGYIRNGRHYHSYGSQSNSAAYRQGLRDGRSDFDRNLPRNMQSSQWSNPQDCNDYEAGYNDGYQGSSARFLQKPFYGDGYGSVSIGSDSNIRWSGPDSSSVFVQVDNTEPRLFASGASGTQAAPWMNRGHIYTFILQDADGSEIAFDQVDLR